MGHCHIKLQAAYDEESVKGKVCECPRVPVSPPSLSARDYQSCRLPVLPIRRELSRGGGNDRPTRDRGFVRNDSAIVTVT